MSDKEVSEFQLKISALVSLLVKINTNETVELQNWIRLRKLILAPDAASLGIPDRGRSWEALTQPDGKFEKAILFLQGLPPDVATDILLKEVLPVIRRNLGYPKQHLSEAQTAAPAQKKMKLYTLWAHPEDTNLTYLKSVEQKWQMGGFLLGPIWILIQGGPPLLALLILAIIAVPFFVFGISAYTVVWALIFWSVNARCHSGLQAIRLKSLDYQRLMDIRAASHEDAQAQYKQSQGIAG